MQFTNVNEDEGIFSIILSHMQRISSNNKVIDRVIKSRCNFLEALPVDNGWAALVVLLLGDPICWKVDREDRMDPPIQTEYFLSGGAMILILMVEGARAVISFPMRSAIPGYVVVPPDMTVLAYRSFLMSTSHFMMEL